MTRRPFLFLSLCAAPPAAQQGRGTILGTIADSTGAAIPGTAVVVTNTGTNAAFRAESNAEGFYIAPELPVGAYSIAAERPGFKKTIRSGITLQVDMRAQVDITLQVGGVTESIEVTGEAPLVDTSSATVGKVVEQRRVTDLPVNGRSAFALMLIAPGVKLTAGPTASGFSDRGTQLSQVSINGGPTSLNAFVVDGGNNNRSYHPDISANPAVDAVEEFKVQSNTMSAEFGFTLGGVVNVVTKAGTNNAHGTLYEFVRNSAFDALNTFSTTKTPFTCNQYGGKDRTFLFGNYEEYCYARGSSSINTVLTSRLDPVAVKALSYIPLPNRTPSNASTNSDDYYNTQTSYTAGKLISDNVAVPLNWFGEQVSENGWRNGKYDRTLEKSVDPTDVSQRVVLSGIYELPFGKGRRFAPSNSVFNVLASGWRLMPVTTLQTGIPLTVRGASNFRADRPTSTGTGAKLDDPSRTRWFNTDAFMNPPGWTMGNVGKMLPGVRSPGAVAIDLSVIKDTYLTEALRLQLRAEAFNFPNFVNLGFPDDSFSPGVDGKTGVPLSEQFVRRAMRASCSSA